MMSHFYAGSDNDDDVDEDDDEGWITPGNIEAMKQASKALTQPEVTDLPVACVTTDYAMQVAIPLYLPDTTVFWQILCFCVIIFYF